MTYLLPLLCHWLVEGSRKGLMKEQEHIKVGEEVAVIHLCDKMEATTPSLHFVFLCESLTNTFGLKFRRAFPTIYEISLALLD